MKHPSQLAVEGYSAHVVQYDGIVFLRRLVWFSHLTSHTLNLI